MNYRDIIVFDFETGGRNPHKCQPTQIAAIAIHARKLTMQPGGVFNSEMRPILDDEKAVAAGLDPVEDEALEITHKTRAKLARAPLPKTVWKKFGQFCNKYNFKRGRQKLFNPIFTMDLMQHVYCWFENNADVKGYSMDYMRDYFGMPSDNAHDALQDVKDTANILIKFLKMQRNLSKKIKFEKAFAKGEMYVV